MRLRSEAGRGIAILVAAFPLPGPPRLRRPDRTDLPTDAAGDTTTSAHSRTSSGNGSPTSSSSQADGTSSTAPGDARDAGHDAGLGPLQPSCAAGGPGLTNCGPGRRRARSRAREPRAAADAWSLEPDEIVAPFLVSTAIATTVSYM